jgi:hypothetical protein
VTAELRAYVHEVYLWLEEGVDERAPGGAVTIALCGSYEHQGTCRWPHNNSIHREEARARLRTVFIAPVSEEDAVRKRITTSLWQGSDWAVLEESASLPTRGEQALVDRLKGTL